MGLAAHDSRSGVGTTPRDAWASPLVQSRRSFRESALLYWGLLNGTTIVIVALFPALFVGAGLQRLFYGSVGLWVLTAIASGLVPLRLPVAIALMIPLQLWFSFCTLYGEIAIAHVVPQNGLDYIVGVYVLCFFMGAGLSHLERRTQVWAGRIFIGLCVFSAFVALAQVARFGPALQYNQFISAQDLETRTREFTTIRAQGVFAGIGWSAVYSLMAVAMIAAKWRSRNASVLDVLAILLLLAAALSNQVRNQIPLVGIVVVGVLWLAVKRHRAPAIMAAGVVATGFVAVLVANAERFSYLFSDSTSTFDYRRLALWSQARHIAAEHPWTGIGVEPAFASWTTQVLPNKWVSTSLMDNGWYITLAWGGYPALFLLICIVVAGLLQTPKLFHEAEDGWPASFAGGTLVFAVAIALGLFFGNQYTNPVQASFMMIYCGIAVGPSLARARTKRPLRPRVPQSV